MEEEELSEHLTSLWTPALGPPQGTWAPGWHLWLQSPGSAPFSTSKALRCYSARPVPKAPGSWPAPIGPCSMPATVNPSSRPAPSVRLAPTVPGFRPAPPNHLNICRESFGKIQYSFMIKVFRNS